MMTVGQDRRWARLFAALDKKLPESQRMRPARAKLYINGQLAGEIEGTATMEAANADS